LTEYEKKV